MANKVKSIIFYLLILSSFSSSLLASDTDTDTDILTHYRFNGIENIEKKLDQDLASSKYWLTYLKHQDIKFGYLEPYTNVLTCNKLQSDLMVYVKDANNTYELKKKI